MKQRKCIRRLSRLMSVIFAALTVISLMPITVSARENGNVVLPEDYYGLCDGNAAKVPGLTYRCSGHGDKMVAYYVEEENDYMRTIPGIIERVGNKIRYIKAYYCSGCYSQFKSGIPQPGHENSNKRGDQLGISGGTLDDYFQYLGEHNTAFLADCGFYFPPKDDFDNMPEKNYSVGTSTITEQPNLYAVDENGCIVGNSGKALTTVSGNKPDENDPLAHWDMPGAYAFYNVFYTGMSRMINKPASDNDPAWDTVRDMTRIYYMKRQQEGQLAGPRVNYSLKWYGYDYSMLGEWVVTDLMAEYKTGEICGYVSYVGSSTEVAVPETVTIPLYGDVKIIGLDIENHNLQKVYVNDNVTCIRRLSSVNLLEISGCKNLEYIEKYAFQNDVSLQSIPEMPKLDWIAMGAFEGCISLRDIKLPDNMTFIDFTAFGWYDTVLGNYDIGMTDQSWEDFQYLSDLSDNDKILGITLYAKKGSTTYKLLDTLINKNDALTPALDDDGKPYFKSYGDAIAMMSGEVKNYTSHWNLKSSGEYKGDFASCHKDVDDSTGGRLGEYGDGEPSYSPKKILENGGVTGGLLLVFVTTTGIAGYKKNRDNAETENDPDDEYWGIGDVYDDLDRADKTKLYFDILDAFSDKIEKLGKGGKIGKGLIELGKAAQKACDVYADTGDFMLALEQARISSFGAGKLMGELTDAVPAIGTWDMVSGLLLGNSKAADAISVGANVEHLSDFIIDMRRTTENLVIPGYNKGTVFTLGEMRERLLDGSYGENLQNLTAASGMANAESVSQIWNGIFGEEGMGFSEFMNGVCDTATRKTTENSLASGYLLEMFNNAVERYYSNL